MSDANFLDISTQQVTTASTSVKSANSQMEQILGNIRRQMEQLSEAWSSPAYENIRQRFLSLDKTFQAYYEVINNYAVFLDKTVESYDQLETKIEGEANKFRFD